MRSDGGWRPRGISFSPRSSRLTTWSNLRLEVALVTRCVALDLIVAGPSLGGAAMAAGVLVSLSPWLTAERAAGGTSVSSLSPAVSCLEESDKGQETQKPPGQDHSSGSHRWTVTGGARVPGLVSPLSWGHWFGCRPLWSLVMQFLLLRCCCCSAARRAWHGQASPSEPTRRG
jgi:hypothetical protein